MKKNYLRPIEAVELIPDCPFSANEIGSLLSMGIVKGYKRSKHTLVCIESLQAVIKYRQTVNAR